jgi:CHAT domain-containing protein/tetratricopeptide (TPR) repeat protein
MPAPNPERLLALLQQFINAPSWDASRRIVEQHPELLTEEADALLARVLEAYRNDPRAQRLLNEHRDLLRRCREDGIEAAFAGRETGDADPEAALRAILEQAESDPEARAALEALQHQAAQHPLMQAIEALIEADSPAEVLDAMQAHPILLSDEADAGLRQFIENAEQMGRAGLAHHVEERYQLLQQLREQGGDPQQMAALAEVSSPEELEALVAEHPALADVLVQGVGTLSDHEEDPRVETIYAFINADTWLDTMRVVQAHPELLSDETDELFALMLTQAEAAADARTARILREHHELLRRCREVGAEVAFAEKMGLPPGVDPREIAETAAQRGGGSRELEIPPAFTSDVQALQRILIRLQREPHLASRRVEILGRMIARPTIEQYPAFKAAMLNDLGNAYQDLPTGDRGANLQRAIQCYQQALTVYTPEAAPLAYAMTQNNLGSAYRALPTGDRGANLQRAIQCYQQALTVYTPEAAPFQYATTQNNLGNAYSQLPTGDRTANLQRAIQCYRQALRFRTPKAAPFGYATTQNNLGTAYLNLPTGDRAANLQRAIQCYQQALHFRTPEAAPLAYAMTQNNLGTAYLNLPTGDQGTNLQRAIQCYQQALRFRTPKAAPFNYATTQNNLGLAYADLPTGDRGANLQRAIQCYQQALRFRTPEAAPLDYAGTQNNLGNAYQDLSTGDRGANLQRAIQCYQQALRFRTPEAAPLDYAGTQNNLGNAYLNLPTGDRGAHLQRAIQCYQQALTVYTPEAAPLDYAMTQNNLGNAYLNLPTGDRGANLQHAIQCYQQALTVYTPEAAPLDYAGTQNNLGNAYQDLPTGDRGANLQRAIQCYQQALRFRPPEAAPLDYAMTQNNLGNAYLNLPTGDRGANLQRAIQCYQQALTVYTPEAAPLDYAMTQNNLGNAYLNLPTGDRGANLQRAIQCYQQALDLYTSETWPERSRDLRRHLGAAHFTARRWEDAHNAFATARDLTEAFYAAALLREVREQEVGANARMVARDAFCLARMGRPAEAWHALERGRARALRQGMDRARARRALASAAPAARERYESLTGREQALREALALPEDDPRRRPYHEVRDELASVARERQAIERDLLASAGIDLGVPTSAELQGAPLLQDGRTGLLSVVPTDHGTAAFLLTAGGLRHRVIEDFTRSDVEALVQGPDDDPEWGGWLGAYFPQFASQRARDHWRATMDGTLDALGRRLWPALDAMLRAAGVDRLVLVPQGMLFLLPLHACPLDGTAPRVCDRYTVAYAPAGAVLARMASEEITPSDNLRPLIVDRPTPDLRHTVSVAPAIESALDNPVTLWEREATQPKVLETIRSANVLHFYGHGEYNWIEPEQSGLVLTPDREGNRSLLTVEEMRDAMNLSQTRLVTLSACETGLTEIGGGLADEYIGLPGVLLQAGARAVVASLWAVSPLATALLMGRFYEAWDRGAVPAAEALRAAQRWLRTRSRAEIAAALDDLDARWAPWAAQDDDPAMRRRAQEQYWVIREAKRRLAAMDETPFAHPYWWAAFQAVGDVL